MLHVIKRHFLWRKSKFEGDECCTYIHKKGKRNSALLKNPMENGSVRLGSTPYYSLRLRCGYVVFFTTLLQVIFVGEEDPDSRSLHAAIMPGKIGGRSSWITSPYHHISFITRCLLVAPSSHQKPPRSYQKPPVPAWIKIIIMKCYHGEYDLFRWTFWIFSL